jgi:hypothetical protein
MSNHARQPEAVRQELLAHLASEVDCQFLEEETGRIGCLLPLEYPDGDGVVVWVRESGGVIEVTDYGEGFSSDASRTRRERQRVSETLEPIARGLGLTLAQGRVSAWCDSDALGEFVWRVGTGSMQIAQAVSAMVSTRQGKREREIEFVSEVERTLRTRQLPVERGHKLTGQSGHIHRATIFIPSSESIFEPITGHWNQVAATYATFGDLGQANGYHRYSVIDDRHDAPEGDVEALLIQVSDVLTWTKHETWLESVLN